MSVVHVEYPETMVCLFFRFFFFLLMWLGTADTGNRTISGSDHEQRVLTILVWVPSIASGIARPVRKAKRNARAILGTLSWQHRFSILVCEQILRVIA